MLSNRVPEMDERAGTIILERASVGQVRMDENKT